MLGRGRRLTRQARRRPVPPQRAESVSSSPLSRASQPSSQKPSKTSQLKRRQTSQHRVAALHSARASRYIPAPNRRLRDRVAKKVEFELACPSIGCDSGSPRHTGRMRTQCPAKMLRPIPPCSPVILERKICGDIKKAAEIFQDPAASFREPVTKRANRRHRPPADCRAAAVKDPDLRQSLPYYHRLLLRGNRAFPSR